jgi:hypothetical protein
MNKGLCEALKTEKSCARFILNDSCRHRMK